MSSSPKKSYLGVPTAEHLATPPMSRSKDESPASSSSLRIRGGGSYASKPVTQESDSEQEDKPKDTESPGTEEIKKRPSMTLEKSVASSMWSAGEPGEGVMYANMLRDMEHAREKKRAEEATEEARLAKLEVLKAMRDKRFVEPDDEPPRSLMVSPEEEEEETSKAGELKNAEKRFDVVSTDMKAVEAPGNSTTGHDSDFEDQEEKTTPVKSSSQNPDAVSYLPMSQEDPGAVAVATNLEVEGLITRAGNMSLIDTNTNNTPKTKDHLVHKDCVPDRDVKKYHSPSDSIMSPTTQKLGELKGKALKGASGLGRSLFGHRVEKDEKKDNDDAEGENKKE